MSCRPPHERNANRCVIGLGRSLVDGADREIVDSAGGLDLFRRVSRKADQRILADRAAYLLGTCVGLSEVNSVRGAGNCELRLVVDYEEGVVRVAEPAKHPSRLDDLSVVGSLVPELHDVDAGLKRGPQYLLGLPSGRLRFADQVQARTLEPHTAAFGEALRLWLAGLDFNGHDVPPPAFRSPGQP